MDEWEKYEMHHRSRLAFKPGLTGMWQVSGRSNITDFEEVVRLDTEYIKKWSPGLDIMILFKTVAVVLGKVGSKYVGESYESKKNITSYKRRTWINDRGCKSRGN